MKNTVIFDLDGTLLNTLDDLSDAVNYALEAHDMPTRSLQEVRSFVGNGIRLLVERAVPVGTPAPLIEECFATFRAYYLTHSRVKTAPYEGVLELLRTLKAQGYKMAIVSNKFQAGVDELAQSLFCGLVPVAIGERVGIPTKPDPALVQIALKELGASKEEAVYVGDSDVDVLTAKNAGLDLIAVTWGFRDEDFLREKGATVFAHAPADIPDLLL